MSLETLLEAANFLELRNQSTVKTRAKEAAEFHPYAKNAPPVINTNRVRQNSVGDGDCGSETEEDGEKRRSGGAGTREVHNKLEKNRRAHLKDCFEMLRQQVPNLEDHKTSNLSILRSAQKCIQNMKRHAQDLKLERERLNQQNTRELIKIGELRQELADLNIEIDINNFMPQPGDDSDSDSTATACTDSPILSDVEMELTADTDVAPKTVLCITPSGGKPMQLSSTSSKVIMPSCVKTTPQVTKIVVPVAPPVMPVTHPRIPTLVPRPQQAAGVNQVAVSGIVTAAAVVPASNTTRATLKTSTAHIRPQTMTQKVLQQHIQQQQLKAQLQQRQQIQLQLQQQTIRHMTLQQTPQQVLTVNATPAIVRPTMLRMLKPIGHVRTALAVNQILPSVVTPSGASLVPCTPIITLPMALSSGSKPVTGVVTPQGVMTPQTTLNKYIPVSISTAMTSSVMSVPMAGSLTTVAMATKPVPQQQHIIAAPMNQMQTAHLMTPVQMSALTQLISQALPQPMLPANVPLQTQVMTAGTQLINPINVMSPILSLPSDLAQTQFGAHVLKSLGQIPMIQQPFTLQSGVVVVSLPSCVTTTTPTAIATVQVAVTRSS